jgi:hypothetical protein
MEAAERGDEIEVAKWRIAVAAGKALAEGYASLSNRRWEEKRLVTIREEIPSLQTLDLLDPSDPYLALARDQIENDRDHFLKERDVIQKDERQGDGPEEG